MGSEDQKPKISRCLFGPEVDNSSRSIQQFTPFTPLKTVRFRRKRLNCTDLREEIDSTEVLKQNCGQLSIDMPFLVYGLDSVRRKYCSIFRELGCNHALTIDEIHKSLFAEESIDFSKFGLLSNFVQLYSKLLFARIPGKRSLYIMDDEIIRSCCQLAIKAAKKAGVKIYFIVDGINKKRVVDYTLEGFTSAELRYFNRKFHRDPEQVSHVKLIANGKKVDKIDYCNDLNFDLTHVNEFYMTPASIIRHRISCVDKRYKRKSYGVGSSC